MDLGDYRSSGNMRDMGTGRGGARGGALPIQLIFLLVRFLGWKKTAILCAVAGGVYFVLPADVRQNLAGGGAQGAGTAQSGASACSLSQSHADACVFSSKVLASTEDVWKAKFQNQELPKYGARVMDAYQEPVLGVFNRGVDTACGYATSDIGPFYCPGDRQLYIDPSFYRVMETRLKAPGDFAQAYVIAHEVGHHIQNLIGSSRIQVPGESKNQVSVRVELQADCLAGVWGHASKDTLGITEDDLKEALNAAHAIGDDQLGHSDTESFTHGSSEQRMRWFKRGFDKGDPRQCDTFAVKQHSAL